MSVTPIAGRALERHERQFLALVARHLRDVPRSTRDDVMRAATEHLIDRPPTADDGALRAAVGTPSDYAADLRITHGLGPERTDWWARWIAVSRVRRCIGVVTTLLLLGATVAGVATYRWWVDWEADVRSNSFGARYTAGDPIGGIVRTSTITSSQVTVPYGGDRGLEVEVLLTADERVTLTEVRFPLGEGSIVRLVGMDMSSALGSHVWHPFEPVEIPSAGLFVRFRFAFTECVAASPGVTIFYDRVHVTYHTLGRDRHATVPLIELLALETDCPR